jgi:hypothetical protein
VKDRAPSPEAIEVRIDGGSERVEQTLLEGGRGPRRTRRRSRSSRTNDLITTVKAIANPAMGRTTPTIRTQRAGWASSSRTTVGTQTTIQTRTTRAKRLRTFG